MPSAGTKPVGAYVEPLEFNYFSGKTKLRFKDEKNEFKASANVRAKKDSLIWISVSVKLGFEGLRLLIDQDSVAIINRGEKTYTKLSYEEFSEQLNFNLSYDLIQSVLLGDMPLPNTDSDQVVEDGNFVRIVQNKEDLVVENYIDKNLNKLFQIKILEKQSGNSLQLDYKDFKALENKTFAHSDNIVLNYDAKSGNVNTEISLEYNKVSFEDKPLRFPFNIPKRYGK